MARSRRIAVDDTDSWLFREFFSVDPNAGSDGTVDHGAADYILCSELGNGDVAFSAIPAVHSDLTTSFRSFVVWGKGIISFGQPTEAQLAFMAAADANTNFGNFPGAFISTGFQDPNGPDIFVGLLDPDKVGLQNAYTRVEFGDTIVLIYADRITVTKANAVSDTVIIDLDNGIRLTSADAEGGAYRLTRFITVDGSEAGDILTGTAAAQSIHGHGGNDTITAGTGASDLYGDAGNDRLTGGIGIDHLFGGDGTDTISAGAGDLVDGGSGDDTITAARSVQIAGGIGSDTLVLDLSAEGGLVNLTLQEGADGSFAGIGTSYSGIERINIVGSAFNDILTGNSGANTINGGSGADIINGGAGNDTLDAGIGGVSPEGAVTSFGTDFASAVSLDNAFSNVGGAAPQARIEIEHSVFEDIYAYYKIEVSAVGDLTLPSEMALYDADAVGSPVIAPTSGDVFTSVYDDLPIGTYVIGITIIGEFPDFGSGDRRRTDGYSVSFSTATVPNRQNVLTGGDGNDTYLVHRSDDLVVEKRFEGSDTVIADLNWTLGSFLENLTLKAGAGAINGMGNTLANTIVGNEASNILNGGGGNDTLIGGRGNDFLRGDAGDDRMAGGAGDDGYRVDSVNDVVIEKAGEGTDKVTTNVSLTLADNVEILVMAGLDPLSGTGNALANQLFGNAAANLLDGGRGIDLMLGGGGDDLYRVDHVSDAVYETVTVASSVDAGGKDTVLSSVTYSLEANGRQFIENITLTGSTAIDATGNSLANLLRGNGANNMLSGSGGADTLMGYGGDDRLLGGPGRDTLTGGSGNDVLNPGSGTDTLSGGTGADVFLFNDTAILDAKTKTAADTIADFSHAERDRIDLRAVDANALVAGDQAFVYRGTAAFTRHAGELRIDASASGTFLAADQNGDGSADFYIRLTPGLAPVAADFLL